MKTVLQSEYIKNSAYKVWHRKLMLETLKNDCIKIYKLMLKAGEYIIADLEDFKDEINGTKLAYIKVFEESIEESIEKDEGKKCEN